MDTLQHLRMLNARFIHNHVTNDVAAHDALLHDRFICISSSGRKIGREDYLKAWANLFDPDVIIHWDTRDEEISLFGNVALIRATNKHIELQDGQQRTGMTCYTDTYLFEDGQWKCIEAQLTTVAPEHWPADASIVNAYVRGVLQDRT